VSKYTSRPHTAAFLPFFFVLLVILFTVYYESSTSFPAENVTSTHSILGREMSQRASLPAKLQGAPIPVNSTFPPANYDEQLGFTFTENFTGLSYNVTAVEQQDVYGYGPAYLLNGLTNSGYWYQVGLSWDWPITTGGYAFGFAFNYEVFAPNGSSIYPENAGGLENFSGTINPGDVVELSLNFDTAGVTMQAVDLRTGSIATASYTSFGANVFVGLPQSISNSKGFFTGLMTEQYHVAPYNGSETKVIYSSSMNVSSAWMWVDEFNANTSSLIFLRSSSSPINYTGDFGKLQYFFFEGATLISNGLEFVTGTSGSILLTVSFEQVGGAPPVAPKFVYSSNGSINSVQLGQDPTTYLVDNGSTWSVSGILAGLNSSGERWTTPDTTSGLAEADQTIKIVYFQQYLEDISFNVEGGGYNFSSPDLTFVNNGRPNSILLANTVLGIWVDAGTLWNVTNPLSGSSSLERWVANLTSGVFDSQENISVEYFHENFVSVAYSIIGGGSGFSSPELEATSLNDTVNQSLSAQPESLWLDSGAQWRVSGILNSSSQRERWIARNTSGVVSASPILPVYYHQSLVSLGYSIKGNSSGFSPPQVNWTFMGLPESSALTPSSPAWVDYGTSFNYPALISRSSGERWVADPDSSITILSQPSVSVNYQTQYYVDIVQPNDGGGVIHAMPSGWYNDSQSLLLASASSPGWKLGVWSGTGKGSYTGNFTTATLTATSPLTETAVFFPALTIASGKGGSVSYSYDGNSGSLSGGKNATVYVSPQTVVSLSASSPSALELFANWHGSLNSSTESVLLQVRSPMSVAASFSFNYPLIFVSLAAVASSVLLLVISLYRRGK
jgi:hypothetical protein